jgi:hypothetical protein
MITGVNRPQGDRENKMFIRELKQLKQGVDPAWLIMGNFKLICRMQDKNNGRLIRGLISRFRKAIDHLEIKELNLLGKKFAWSNNQASPSLTKIDKAFCTPTWEQIYDNPALQALSSSSSDHCPLLLTPLTTPRTRTMHKN